MPTYRANPTDATYFSRILTRENLPFEVERFESGVTYIVVKSQRPDISSLARSSGPSIRPVLSLEQLAETAHQSGSPPAPQGT